ncbi:flap endonuclease [Rhodococcus sp. 06-470-2]|uniref:5'-3' exonuclease n=1 Tax=unclassified Rhodococcus (in: high G+C Gram-positive bacteria) TaxID=192944 RepID=UPI000B9BD31C|nr:MULTISPECIES: 5'-3' exonuclease [unclassified Rhodococcus (in: high G+C Gram-positive bacteria)]OZC61223.1 flap endonuclease [Rhodococcus sp. 06-470-2]OZE06280.1 flap endonuclease [Rhodococcus sp. 05-2255-3B1]OZE09326.1 flap endonuclease [Rhodococcus sp. 05-2255-3C]OZE18431.1 flap endonuclease [Rhodococcus sp. 05-2255-2A2]OZE64388.1 flap endonuclease [Rhodococcus sp. 05-2221-1B]
MSPMTAPGKSPLLLLDGASLWFRAYYALPESITAPDGRPVNAVRGFLDMISALIARTEPSRLAVCLDLDWRPQFRVDLVPSYKAHRVADAAPEVAESEEVPETLTPQVNMIMDVLAALGIATAGADGLEADDVLGTLAARERQDPVVVVSGDRDLLQVAADEPNEVRVLYVGRGLAKAELFDPALVSERYGVPLHRAGAAYAELALLRGDASDGLPGVKGIGEKTASTLMLNYESVAALRAAALDPASDMAKGIRAKLANASEYLDAALPVVRVVTDADVVLSKSDEIPAEPADLDALNTLAETLGIENAVARLVAAMAATASTA